MKTDDFIITSAGTRKFVNGKNASDGGLIHLQSVTLTARMWPPIEAEPANIFLGLPYIVWGIIIGCGIILLLILASLFFYFYLLPRQQKFLCQSSPAATLRASSSATSSWGCGGGGGVGTVLGGQQQRQQQYHQQEGGNGLSNYVSNLSNLGDITQTYYTTENNQFDDSNSIITNQHTTIHQEQHTDTTVEGEENMSSYQKCINNQSSITNDHFHHRHHQQHSHYPTTTSTTRCTPTANQSTNTGGDCHTMPCDIETNHHHHQNGQQKLPKSHKSMWAVNTFYDSNQELAADSQSNYRTRSLPSWGKNGKPRPASTIDDLEELYAQVNFTKKRRNRMRNDNAAIIARCRSRSQNLTAALHLESEGIVVYDERTAL